MDGFFWNPSAKACTLCMDGVRCIGGRMFSQEGWWRASPLDTRAYMCPPNFCLDEFEALRNATLLLAAGAAPPPTNGSACAPGSEGPLCAVCSPGYSLQDNICLPCPKTDSWEEWDRDRRGVLIGFCALGAALFLFFFFGAPLFPGLMPAVTRAAMSCCGCLLPKPAEGRAVRRSIVLLPPPEWDLGKGESGAQQLAPQPRASVVLTPEQLADMPHKFRRQGSVVVGRNATGGGKGRVLLRKLTAGAKDAWGVYSRSIKIVINFLQIAMTLTTTLEVPWPKVFRGTSSRLGTVNIKLVSLPKLGARALGPQQIFRSAAPDASARQSPSVNVKSWSC